MYGGTRDSVTGSLCPPGSFEWSMSVICGDGPLELGRLVVAGLEIVAELEMVVRLEYGEMALAGSEVGLKVFYQLLSWNLFIALFFSFLKREKQAKGLD